MGRMLRLPLRLIPRNAVVRILQGPLKGQRWLAHATTHGAWLGSYDPVEEEWFNSHAAQGDIVFDLGANVGVFTLLASRLVGSGGHVYAFEPLPRNIHYLQRHLALNGVTNVSVVESAVADVKGVERMDATTWGHIGARFSEWGTVEVATTTIDDLVTEGAVRPPDLMKVNIEKAELRALGGASDTLRRHRPVLLLSTHGPELRAGCLALLEGLGYGVVAEVTPHNEPEIRNLLLRHLGE